MAGEFSLVWFNESSYDEEANNDKEAAKVKVLCDSRDNAAAILKDLKDLKKNMIGEEFVRLFERAVVWLTCNNDAETLDAVLDFGREAKLGVSWKKEKDVFSRENLRGNPIMVASQQACVFSGICY